MTTLLNYIIEVGLWIAVFYMFYRLLLQKETFHRLNRIVLLATAVLSFLLPFCIITWHKQVEMMVPVVSEVPIKTVASTSIEEMVPWWVQAGTLIYCAGILFMISQTLLSVYRVKRLISQSERHLQPDGVTIAVVDESIAPASWHRTIILSRKDYEEMNMAIMAHERAHIAHRHTIEVLLVDLITALQWFNPAIWFLRIDLRAIHEYEADEAVLSQGINARQYQYLLIKKAISLGGYSVTNSFNHSALKNRITMMLRTKSSGKSIYKALFVVPVVAVALAVNARTVTDITYLPVEPAAIVPTLSDEATVETVNTAVESSQSVADKQKDEKPKPLYIVDGKEVADIQNIAPESIASMNVLKGEAAIATYGERGKNGVIIVTLKNKETEGKKQTVKGKLFFEDGTPLVGGVVKVRNTNKGVVTNADGEFTLEDVDDIAVLEAIYIGHNTESVAVPTDGSPLHITLKKETGEKKSKSETVKATMVGDVLHVDMSGAKDAELIEIMVDDKKVNVKELNNIEASTIKAMKVEKNKDGKRMIYITINSKDVKK